MIRLGFRMALCLTALMLMSLHCRQESNPNETGPLIHDNSVGLTPFKIGNKWVFQFLSYDSTGTLQTTFTDSITVIRDTLIGNEKWYKIPGFKPADVDYWDWYTNRSDGIWVLRKYLDSAIAFLTFKFPTIPGDGWGNVIHDSTRTLSIEQQADTSIMYEDHYQLFKSDGVRYYYYFVPSKGWSVFEIYVSLSNGSTYLRNKQVVIRTSLR